MSKVSIYLNFQCQAEEAMNFYKQVFNSDFSAPMSYIRDMPAEPGAPTLPEHEKHAVMHVALPILNGVELMASDMLESIGHKLIVGNNTTINLTLDSKEEADRLYMALSEGGPEADKAPMQDQFWAYWGCCLDRFGIRWMFNVMKPAYS